MFEGTNSVNVLAHELDSHVVMLYRKCTKTLTVENFFVIFLCRQVWAAAARAGVLARWRPVAWSERGRAKCKRGVCVCVCVCVCVNVCV